MGKRYSRCLFNQSEEIYSRDQDDFRWPQKGQGQKEFDSIFEASYVITSIETQCVLEKFLCEKTSCAFTCSQQYLTYAFRSVEIV